MISKNRMGCTKMLVKATAQDAADATSMRRSSDLA
jgi:hypothetical protein